jgi:hypothetical protein
LNLGGHVSIGETLQGRSGCISRGNSAVFSGSGLAEQYCLERAGHAAEAEK